MALKLEILLEAVDRLSAPLARARARVAALAAPIGAVAAATARLGGGAGFDRLAAGLGAVAGRARETAGALAQVSGRAALLGTGAAVGGLALFRGQFLSTARTFENLNAILETTEGGAEAGRRAFAWVSDFAARTPYQLEEVVTAFGRLSALGADARRFLQPAGDAAAALGVPLSQAAEAFSDAMTGEFERLKEFGITASREGRNVALEYMKNGRTMRVTVNAENRAMIASTLAAIWNDRYGGAMERRSRTWDGMVSNLLDNWTRWKAAVMDAGPFDWLKGQIDLLLARTGMMAEDGSAQSWAERLGGAITDLMERTKAFFLGSWSVTDMMDPDGMQRVPGLFDTIGDTMDRLRARVQPVVDLVRALVGPVSGAAIAFGVLGLVIAGPLIGPIIGLAGALITLGAALLATPVGWFVGVVGLLAAAALFLWANWDRVLGWLEAAWAALPAPLQAALRIIAAPVLALIRLGRAVPEAWASARDVFGRLGDVVGRGLGAARDRVAGFAAGVVALAARIPAAWRGAVGFFARLRDGIGAALSGAGAAAVDGIVALAGVVRRGWDAVAGFFGDVAGGIAARLAEAVPGLAPVIAALVDGAGRLRAGWDGLAALFERVGRAIGDALARAADAATAPVRALAGLFGTLRDAWDAAAAAAERLLGLLPRLSAPRAPELPGGITPGDREGIQRFLDGLPGAPAAPDTPSRRLFQPSGARLEDLPRLMQPGAMPAGLGGREARVDLGGVLRIRVEDGRVVAAGRLNDPRARLDIDQGLLVGAA